MNLTFPAARTYRIGGGSAFAWPPAPRPTLPLPPGNYDKVLPFTPPAGPDKLFYRGNFCGVRVPGMRLLPGMAGYTVEGWKDNKIGGKNPPFMSIDVPRYTDDERQAILQAHADRGYTHFQLSIGHAIEQGLSIADYVSFANLVQSFGFFADHWFLGGGDFNARDMGADYWRPLCQPWIDALLAEGAIGRLRYVRGSFSFPLTREGDVRLTP